MNLTLAGTGCGNLSSMTREAVSAIKNADILIGASRLLSGIPEEWCARRIPSVYAKDILDIILPLKESAANICVLFSGDSGFYSGTRNLLSLLKDEKIDAKVLPGISSIQMLSARLQIPWQDWLLVSAHGIDCDPVHPLMNGKPVFYLTGGKLQTADLCRILADAGLGDLQAAAGERLSYEDEKITRGTVSDMALKEFDPLSVLLVFPPPRTADLSPGIEDDKFIRGKTPMTKQNARALILSHMHINPEDTVWDIGAGTGSVSIEMSMKAHKGHVFAIERDAEGIKLIRSNRVKFGCWNLSVIDGCAPDALSALPAPDKVFIGGSGGKLKEIIDCIHAKNPDTTICVTAILLETINEAMTAMLGKGLDTGICQISVSNAHPAGGKHMMKAENPVYIITGRPSSD